MPFFCVKQGSARAGHTSSLSLARPKCQDIGILVRFALFVVLCGWFTPFQFGWGPRLTLKPPDFTPPSISVVRRLE
jgi:hypothetical protein